MRKLAGILLILAGQGPAVLAEGPAASTYDIVAEGGRKAGTVSLAQAPRGLLIRVEATGLAPGWHGMHIHSVATCADPGFKASGGHVHDASITTPVHGLLNANANDLGDLPNIFAGPDGKASAEVFSNSLSLGVAAGRLNLLDADGSALVIHASADDYMSQPIGGAGARIACAAIK
jgi:Cu-Zn family superoxide dismutase